MLLTKAVCNGFDHGKWDVPANTAKIADMVKTAASCFIYVV